MARRPVRRRPVRRTKGSSAARPLVAFLLIASFGILFAGCGNIEGPEAETLDGGDDLTFTEEDVARFQELAGRSESGTVVVADDEVTESGSTTSSRASAGGTPLPTGGIALDLSRMNEYQAARASTTTDAGKSTYRVTNAFVNVRAEPNVRGAFVTRLNNGELLTDVEFVNAGWAKGTTPAGVGYVSTQYIAKQVSSSTLEAEKKVFNNVYYVAFNFVNVRAEPNQQSAKLGTIPGQAFVKPISIDGDWARVPFEGKDGFVSSQYLKPFLPQFIVRQDSFVLPILQYDVAQQGVFTTLGDHVRALKQAGARFITFRDLRDTVLTEKPLPENAVLLSVTGLTTDNVRPVSDLLYSNSVRATLFIETRQLGLSGITQKQILTLVANGFDLESAAHSGDDLRSLTNAQVKLEVEQSRKLLEDMADRDVFVIAYPQGGVNDRVTQKAAEAGYLFGVGNTPDKDFSRDKLLRLPSYAIPASMSGEDVVRIVKP